MAKQSKYSDAELMKILEVDAKTLKRFQTIQRQVMADAKKLYAKRTGKIKVLGISGSARDEHDMAAEDSSSGELLKRCLANCQKLGADTEFIQLRKFRINYCKSCYSTVNTQCHFYCSCYAKGTPLADDMTNIMYDKIIAADAIIFATPVNNFKISTLMAAFIDRCISLDGSIYPADPSAPKNRELNYKHMKFIELTADNDIAGSGFLRRFQGKTAGIIVSAHEAGASMTIGSLFLTLNNYGMFFPPFGTLYATASICNSTNKDKAIVLSDCYAPQLANMASNICRAAKMLRSGQPSDWRTDAYSD